MTLYMLDTDTCSYVMKRSFPALLERLRAAALAAQVVSVVSVAELLYGVELSSRPADARSAFDAFIRHPRILDWSIDAAQHYAQIRADLKRRGEMIGANNLLIAAHARSLGAVLVSNNLREFARVPDLSLENWTQ